MRNPFRAEHCSPDMAKKQSRKTRAQRAQEKREKRVRFWMGAFIIGIMILSSIAFVFVFHAPATTPQGTATTFPYEIRDNMIYTQVDGKELSFYSFPDQSFSVPQEAVDALTGTDVVVVAFDPTDTENAQIIELVRWDLATYLPAQQAALVLSPSEQYTYPVGGCEQATPVTPVVKIINGTPDISINGSCVTIQGQGLILLQLRDQLLYAYYGLR